MILKSKREIVRHEPRATLVEFGCDMSICRRSDQILEIIDSDAFEMHNYTHFYRYCVANGWRFGDGHH